MAGKIVITLFAFMCWLLIQMNYLSRIISLCILIYFKGINEREAFWLNLSKDQSLYFECCWKLNSSTAECIFSVHKSIFCQMPSMLVLSQHHLMLISNCSIFNQHTGQGNLYLLLLCLIQFRNLYEAATR